MKYQAFSILLLVMSTLLSACDGDGVVSSVTIDMVPLEQTLGGEAHELSGSGSISVTPFDVNANTLYTSVNFDIATRSGEIPPLPLGTWKFYVSGQQNGQSFFGVSKPFEVSDYEQVLVPTFFGKSQCTGLLPPLRGPEGIGGSSDLARLYDGAEAIALEDGRVLIIGGGSIDGQSGQLNAVSQDIQYYDPIYGVVRVSPTQLAVPRAFHQTTLLNDGRILVAGGITGITPGGQYTVDNTAELITINADGSLSIVGPITMDKPRYQHNQVLLNDGSVLLAGGLDASSTILSSATRYFPDTGVFVAQGNLNTPRVDSSIAPLKRNVEKALITGGMSETGPVASTELFTTDVGAGCVPTPTATVGCFVTSAALNRPRWGHSTASLEDGSVFIVGGFQSGSLVAPRDAITTLEQYKFQITYDANGNAVSATVLVQDAVGLLNSARGHGTLVRMNQRQAVDQFAFIGGEVTSSKNTVELISAQALSQGVMGAQASLSLTCPLSEDRLRTMAVTTPEGGVMIFGGVKRGNDPTSGNAVNIASRRIEMIYPTITNIAQAIPSLSE
ncbi:MAG: hypothetical protein CMH49_10375 [Myxococcales bacterium]|nr:hypothetical protein [Myxococcales bacterium]